MTGISLQFPPRAQRQEHHQLSPPHLPLPPQQMDTRARENALVGFGVLVFGVWGLEFGVWSLEFGVWSLEFGVWCSCLVFGV